MNYRKFGRLDWKASVLGFGCMRLPTIGEDQPSGLRSWGLQSPQRPGGNVDEAEAIRMIRYAIDHGVNYVDTGYTYNASKSEIVVGKALKDGYREKVRLTTKTATQSINSWQELDRIFNEQLSKPQTDHFDCYLFGGLRKEEIACWSKVKKLHLVDWAEKKIAEGKIGHLGFSYHGEFDAFKEIIDGYEGWTLCQMIYNYIDAELGGRSPGIRGLRYAAQKGLAVSVMEPIQGGSLAVKPPNEIQMLLDEAKSKRSLADLALQWVWKQPEVSLALSGMSSMNQVIENLESASLYGPGVLTESELKLISKIREVYQLHLDQIHKL
ncbi:MAG: aldo/keto reductase [Candidatus Bathyarchaeota archaeon]